jgi:hypothetical protein
MHVGTASRTDGVCLVYGVTLIAGSMCRRYTLPEVRQEHYSSCELGVKLAEAIVGRFQLPQALLHTTPATQWGGTQHAEGSSSSNSNKGSAGSASAQTGEQTDRLPALQEGKVLGCTLPSGQIFLCCSCPDAAVAPVLTPPDGGCTLVSSSGGGSCDNACVLSISLDAASHIREVAYVGSPGTAEAATAAKIMGLVGLPFSYIAAGLGLPDGLSEQLAAVAEENAVSVRVSGESDQGVQQVPAGLTAGPEAGVWLVETDVLAGMQQPWAQLLFHADFSQFRQKLLTAGAEAAESKVEQEQGSVEQEVRQLVVDCLQSCRGQLGGYHIEALGAATTC